MTILHAAEIRVYISICLIAKIEFIAIIQFLSFDIFMNQTYNTNTKMTICCGYQHSFAKCHNNMILKAKQTPNQCCHRQIKSGFSFCFNCFYSFFSCQCLLNCSWKIHIIQSFCYSKRNHQKVVSTKIFSILRNFMKQSAIHIDNSISAKLLYTVNVRNTTCVNVSTEFAK